jgi:putative transposase
MKRSPQLKLLKNEIKAYGGELRNTRKGRQGPRPISTKSSMHMVLRSTKARGDWSFKKRRNAERIEEIIGRFAKKYGVHVKRIGNVGNHLHLEVQLSNRYTYKPFIRAITSAIAMAITGVSRWNRAKSSEKFWDYRPFTRVIQGFKALLDLRDYIHINQLEGFGCDRAEAVYLVKGRVFNSG